MAIGTVGALLGSAVIEAGATAISANKSAKAASGAAAQNNELQRYIYEDQKEQSAPVREAGLNALARMSSEVGLDKPMDPNDPFANFRSAPGYQFQMDEGLQALERSAASRGMLNSGAFAKDAMRFSQGLADQTYGNYYNRLAGIAGGGQTANAQNAVSGQNYANAVGVNNNNAASARMSAYGQQANALTGLINNGVGIYGAHKGGLFR